MVLGTVGVVLPILPTTPFVLLAGICFSASSARCHAWLSRNRVFGPYLENYRTKAGIGRWHKYGAIAFLWAGLIVSAAITQIWWLYLVLAAVGIGVTTHLLMIPTRVNNDAVTPALKLDASF